MSWFNRSTPTPATQSTDTAEDFIRDQTCLYRHYCINQVMDSVKQFTGVQLTGDAAVNIVQNIRNEKGMGAIADYNLPDYDGPR